MKNFFKKLKEKIIDLTNYNIDEVISDKKSEVGKKISEPEKPYLEEQRIKKTAAEVPPSPKERKREPSKEPKERELKEKEPIKTNHPTGKRPGKSVFRKRENAVEKKGPAGRVQDKPDKVAKRNHGYKKYKKEGK